MDAERTPGATFALSDIGWIDFETRAPVSLKTAGAYRYATEASAIVLAYAIGAGPVRVADNFDQLPGELWEHHKRVVAGEAVWAAWNAGFDRAVWNYSTEGFPELAPHHVIDVMAQAMAAGLPGDLATAARFAGLERKLESGRGLIKLFCLPESKGAPDTHPAEWAQFLEYAKQDIEAMRSVFLHTLQLPRAEWREYWAVEAINQRGVVIDVPLATRAAALAEEDKVRSRAELRAITGDPGVTVDMVKRLSAWLLARLPAEGRAIMTKREEEVDEDGKLVRPAKHALTRARVEKLIAYVQGASNTEELTPVLRLLQIRLYGGSKTPAKFSKMLSQQVDGVLYGQYVFGGAAQTGRASSKGVQIHNLARDTLKDERSAIDLLLSQGTYGELAEHGTGEPVARKLSLLIRPTFVPTGDRVFVWSDWSQIEARVLPWLCDHDSGARTRLQIFRAVDADPKLPDLYTLTASTLSHVPIHEVTKAMRQRGKVAELALGYCGGVGALQSMAAGYGLHLPDAEARATVEAWRRANPWAGRFAQDLWDAALRAYGVPGVPIRVGRVHFNYLAGYLGGTLLCVLPSGRCLAYRRLRWEYLDVLNDDDQPTGEKTRELTFLRGHGRMKLWPGLFVENVTQAVAADVLRGTLVRLEESGAFDTRLHTHDEILLECPQEAAAHVAAELRAVMQQGFDWSEGLPLMSEETAAYYYTKSEEAHGL